jgi:hypothetical protein
MMGKKNNIPRVSTISYQQHEGLKKQYQEVASFLHEIAYKAVLMRDAVDEVGKRLSERHRLTAELAMSLKVQMATMDNMLRSVFKMEPDEAQGFRKERIDDAVLKTEFDKIVEATCERLAPVLFHANVVPGKPGKFITL